VDDDRDTGYTARLAARLRWLRRRRDLSLQDVEAASAGEFKASVLDAYERGERAISVPRLQRLARTYRVPVDQMVPTDDEPSLPPAPGAAPSVDVTTVDSRHHGAQPVVINVGAVDALTVPEGQPLARFPPYPAPARRLQRAPAATAMPSSSDTYLPLGAYSVRDGPAGTRWTLGSGKLCAPCSSCSAVTPAGSMLRPSSFR
jgi:transcriptional regulator with XRE-family HTH domain